MPTITSTLKNSQGTSLSGAVRFEPAQQTARLSTAKAITAQYVDLTVTSGALSITLEPGSYHVTIPGTTPFTIEVPSAAGTYDLFALVTDSGGTGALPPLTRFVGDERFFVDTFSRANTEPGATIGTPEVSLDAEPWIVGSTADWPTLPASDYVYLEDGAVRTALGQTIYLKRDLLVKPGQMGCEVEWVDGNDLGSANEVSLGIAISSFEGGIYPDDFIHCTVTRSAATIQTGFHGSGNLRTHARQVWNAVSDQTLSKDRRYVVTFQLDGAVATLKVGDRILQCEMPQVSRQHGQHVYWEIYSPNATAKDDLKIHTVWAKNSDSVPLQLSAKSGAPGTPRIQELKFPGGTGKASVDTNGVVTDWTADDFSFYFRGTTPVDHREMPGAGGMLSVNSRSDAQNFGEGPILRLFTGVGGGEGTWGLEFLMTNGAESRLAKWYHEVCGRISGRQFDVLLTRDVAANAIEAYLDGGYLPIDGEVESASPPAWNLDFTSSRYIHVGQAGTGSSLGWTGGIQCAAVANCVLDGEDLTLMRRGIIPERRKWATNTPLTTGSLAVGKTYRLGAVGTASYYYTGCTAGDEIHVVSATRAILIRRGTDGNTGALKTLLTTTINASNTVTQTGFMVWFEAAAGSGQQLVDLSSNRLHAAFSGTVTPTIPEQIGLAYEMANQGDANVTLTATGYADVVVPYDTTLTANRTVTLPASGNLIGQRITVVRSAATPGAYTLAVGSAKTIASGTAATVVVRWNGSAWKLTNYSAL